MAPRRAAGINLPPSGSGGGSGMSQAIRVHTQGRRDGLPRTPDPKLALRVTLNVPPAAAGEPQRG